MSSSDLGTSFSPSSHPKPFSDSKPDSKIDLLDPPSVVEKKIRKAVCTPKVVAENGVLAFVEFVLLPASHLRGARKFVVSRERDNLPDLVYTSIAEMHKDYEADVLTPQLLKQAVAKGINELLTPIREKYENDKVWQETAAKGYPVEAPKKKEKKVKNKGTGYPGGAKKKAEEGAGDAKGVVEKVVEKVEEAVAPAS